MNGPSSRPRPSIANLAPFRRLALPLVVPGLVLGVVLGIAPLDRASAETRVLLVFDAEGHRVQHVVRGGSTSVERLREHERLRKRKSGEAATVDGYGDGTLIWLDRGGATLAVERVPDPRVVRVPAPGGRAGREAHGASVRERSAHDRVALEEGSWFARGPDAATALWLRLPARVNPALEPVEWRLDLDASTLPRVR